MNLAYIFLLLKVLPVKDQSTQYVQPGTALFISHKFGGEDLKLDDPYTSGDDHMITLTKFKYYLGNIEFYKSDGTVWKHPQQYHLMEVNDESPSDC